MRGNLWQTFAFVPNLQLFASMDSAEMRSGYWKADSEPTALPPDILEKTDEPPNAE